MKELWRVVDSRTLAPRISPARRLRRDWRGSALRRKYGPGARIGGRAFCSEVGPGLQVVERVHHPATDLAILWPSTVGAVFFEGAAGKAEETSGLRCAQKAWRHAGQRVGHDGT